MRDFFWGKDTGRKLPRRRKPEFRKFQTAAALGVAGLLLGFAAHGEPLSKFQVLEGRILQGAIVKSIPDTGDVSACAATCTESAFCRSFTYIPSRKICELKAESRFQNDSYEGYVSGVVSENPLRSLIADIATGTVREDGKGSGTEEQAIGKPEYRKGATSPDGTASGFVCQQKQVKLEQQAEEFITLNPTEEWLYPGALLQGATIKGGSPTWVGAARSGGRIGLALQTGSPTQYLENVPSMNRLSVLQGINNILARYDGGGPGEIYMTYDEVHSQEHLEAMLGANVTGTNFSAGAKLNVNFDNEKTRLVIRITQKFYTIVYEPPRFPEDVFAAGVTADELDRWIGPRNPPVYVSSVNYGRMLFAVLESELSARELEASFNAAYQSVVDAAAEGSVDYKKNLASTKISLISFGASAAGGLTAAADTAQNRNFDGIYEFLRTSGDFGRTNPGVPIAYQMRSLFDSKPVRLAATTEYTKNVCEPADFGCDGEPKSNKVTDQCGVCGGNDLCKNACPAITHTLGNDYVFVYFDLPKTKIGEKIRYEDGGYYVYNFPRCYRVGWSNVRYSCQESPSGGQWQESKNWTRDANCFNSGSVDQENLRVRTTN